MSGCAGWYELVAQLVKTGHQILHMDIFQEIPQGSVLSTNQISVERLADVEVTLEGNSNHTVNTS